MKKIDFDNLSPEERDRMQAESESRLKDVKVTLEVVPLAHMIAACEILIGLGIAHKELRGHLGYVRTEIMKSELAYKETHGFGPTAPPPEKI